MKTWKRQRNEPPNHATFSRVSVFHRGRKIRQKKLTKISVTVPFRGEFTKFFSKKRPSVPYRGAKNVPY